MKASTIITQVIGICLLQCSLCPLQGQVVFYNPPAPPPITNPTPIEKKEELQQGKPDQQDLSEEAVAEGPVLSDRAAEILDFWFGFIPNAEYFPEDKMSLWLADSPELDRQIAKDYAQDVINAQRGDYNSWRETARGRLALIILLDQFPRHIYHDKPQAFSSDPMARGLVIEGIQRGEDRQLYPIERAFFYLPLEHAEDPAIQNMSVTEYRRLLAEAPSDIKPEMQDFLNYALAHQQQIARFGRFPARNAILGRKSTPEEILFLDQVGKSNF